MIRDRGMMAFLGAAALLCVGFSCARQRYAVVKNPLVEQLQREISVDSMRVTIADLVAFGTRFTHPKQLAVAAYVSERLRRHIPDTRYHTYEYWGVDWNNVVGEVRGATRPREVIIACAHFDSESEKKLALAPGADDNASGCAALLELARVLGAQRFERTLRFIFFSREETGQQGSKAYIKDMVGKGDTIVAAINIDMIAYGDSAEEIDLMTRPHYRWLVETAHALSLAYDIPAKKVVKKGCY